MPMPTLYLPFFFAQKGNKDILSFYEMLKYISRARLQTTVQVRHCRGCKPKKKICNIFFSQVDALFKEKKNTAICKCQLHNRLRSALCCLCEMRNMQGVGFFFLLRLLLLPRIAGCVSELPASLEHYLPLCTSVSIGATQQ